MYREGIRDGVWDYWSGGEGRRGVVPMNFHKDKVMLEKTSFPMEVGDN